MSLIMAGTGDGGGEYHQLDGSQRLLLDELPLSLDLLVQFWLKVLGEFILVALFLFSCCSTRTTSRVSATWLCCS